MSNSHSYQGINISGSFYRNKLKYMDYLRKRCLVNPKRGPFHHRYCLTTLGKARSSLIRLCRSCNFLDPSTIQGPQPHLVQDHPRYVAPQVGSRTGRHEALPRLRGNPGSLRQEKETRRSFRSPCPQTPGKRC